MEENRGLLGLALKKGSSPKAKEFDKIIYWVKQILGLAIGSTLGIMKLQGIFIFILGLVLLSVFSIVYAKNYLEVDEDEVENSKIITEAIGIGFFSFMLTWVLTFSFF